MLSCLDFPAMGWELKQTSKQTSLPEVAFVRVFYHGTRKRSQYTPIQSRFLVALGTPMFPSPSSSSIFNPAHGPHCLHRTCAHVHLCVGGGRHSARIPVQPAHELIHLVLSWRSSLWRLPCQLRPSGQADGELEQVLLLGQERKYSFSPLLSKNMLRAFLSNKKQLWLQTPPQPSPGEMENKNRL